MPKRPAKTHEENATQIRRKSMFIDNSSQLSANLEQTQDENIKGTPVKEATNHMRYMRSNQNNEIERILLHNSQDLCFSVDHSDFPAFNVGMWPKENSDMLTNYPSCALSVPRPIFVADKQCDKLDVCYKRPMTRSLFKTRLRFTRSTYQTALKSNKNIRSGTQNEIYHNSVYDIAERVYMQPDPFFHSSYDYYFTGGNLCVLPQQGKIIHAGGEKLQEILASEFPVVNEYCDSNSLRNVASLKRAENSEIFEFYPLTTSLSNSRQNWFLSRQRNLITLNYINGDQVKSVTRFNTKATPFISFAQSERDINKFIITTMKQHIRLYDLNTNPPNLAKLFQISPNELKISWNTVKPWRENTFIYANEKQFFMIDVRTSPEEWLKEVSFADNSLSCNHISSIQPSKFNNLFYVATNHKLQCMDIRCLKKTSLSDPGGAICCWTHQLRYAPLMMDTFRLHQNEYIALSSPIAGDLHICQLSRERNDDNICLEPSLRIHKHIYSSSCLPYQPPTLFEAFENARLSGKCLRPEANMEPRLKCCTTGMKFFSSSMSDSTCALGLLLTSNSNGDVFASTLSKREDKETEERCNTQSDEIMLKFEQKICEEVKSTLSYSEIKNLKGLRKVFLCKKLSSVSKTCVDAIDNEYNENLTGANNASNRQEGKRLKRLHLGRWQKPLSTLCSYKDALVSNLLSIWDIDIDEERNIRLDNLSNNIKNDPAVEVENWLKKNANPNTPMLSIPFTEISNYVENDTSNIFDSTFDISRTQNAIDFENAAHSTQILDNTIKTSINFDTSGLQTQTNNGTKITVVENNRTKKKNKKYIKGF